MSDSEAIPALWMGVRIYVYETVARGSNVKSVDVTDATPLGVAAFEISRVLAPKLNRVVSTNTDTTIGQLLTELKLK